MCRPDLRYINSSYASNLSIRDNVKSRTLIQSGWFQSQWGSVFRLRDDQNVKVKFENYQGGFRLASYVGGGTGEGGDRLICDDPNNVTDVESDTIRNTCNEWWDLQMYNRITNVKTAARVMIMQRTHMDDLSGHVLETGGWTHLKLPTRFVAGKHCSVVYAEGTKTWTDPRKKAGELLNPALWDEEASGPFWGSGATLGPLKQRSGPLLRTRRSGCVARSTTRSSLSLSFSFVAHLRGNWSTWKSSSSLGPRAYPCLAPVLPFVRH